MHRTNGNTQIKEDLAAMRTNSNRGPNVGIFKLADETQMGGLNSLMSSYDSKSLSGNNNLGEHDNELGMSRMNFVGKYVDFHPNLFMQTIPSINQKSN